MKAWFSKALVNMTGALCILENERVESLFMYVFPRKNDILIVVVEKRLIRKSMEGIQC